MAKNTGCDSTSGARILAGANLLDNALKYGPAGQTVSIELERVGDRARLRVSDEGPGVPVVDRRRIWKPFVRLGTKGVTGGSGIGLAVVRDLIRQHGGTIAVTSAQGGGAQFEIELAVSETAEGLQPRATGEFRASEVAARFAADRSGVGAPPNATAHTTPGDTPTTS